MAVRYQIVDPLPPSWWARNKAFVCLAAGAALGLYLAGGCDQEAADPSKSPSPSVSPMSSWSPR